MLSEQDLLEMETDEEKEDIWNLDMDSEMWDSDVDDEDLVSDADDECYGPAIAAYGPPVTDGQLALAAAHVTG